ncbi:MAG: hypothetical protein ACLVJ6_13575 [Merdibacter sp.]
MTARTVYETYKVTQAQLDDAQQASAAANDTALALLEGKKHCRHRSNWRSSC